MTDARSTYNPITLNLVYPGDTDPDGNPISYPAVSGNRKLHDDQTGQDYVYFTLGRGMPLQVNTSSSPVPDGNTDPFECDDISTLALDINVDTLTDASDVTFIVQRNNGGGWIDVITFAPLTATGDAPPVSIGPSTAYPVELGYQFRIRWVLTATGGSPVVGYTINIWGKS